MKNIALTTGVNKNHPGAMFKAQAEPTGTHTKLKYWGRLHSKHSPPPYNSLVAFKFTPDMLSLRPLPVSNLGCMWTHPCSWSHALPGSFSRFLVWLANGMIAGVPWLSKG